MILLRTIPLFLLPGVALAADSAPWGEIAQHAVNLTILLGLLAYFFGKKLKTVVAERSVEIQRAVDQANEARKAAQQRADALELKLKSLETQLADIRKQAEADAANEAQAIAARAETDVAAIEEAAQRTIRDETARARLALRNDAVALAVQLASSRLQNQITADDQKRLATDFLAALKSDDTIEVANG